jgi:hypothetical protein
MAPMTQFKDQINKSYGRQFDVVEDCLKNVLPNVRIPTAQMDAFAVFLQLFSDHFVNAKSDKKALGAYWKSIKICSFFEGACSAACLQQAFIQQSLRSQHWYSIPSQRSTISAG